MGAPLLSAAWRCRSRFQRYASQSVPPNGSRLGCGRLARRRKGVGR